MSIIWTSCKMQNTCVCQLCNVCHLRYNFRETYNEQIQRTYEMLTLGLDLEKSSKVILFPKMNHLPILVKKKKKKKAVPLFCVYWALTSCKKSEESNEPIHRKRRCLWMDGVEFIRPFSWARGPKIPCKYKKLGKYFSYSTLCHEIQ